jgi:single-strand DNA-binding protein
MSEGLNKACLLGNLGQDPELKFTNGGQAVLKLRLATTEFVPSKDGDGKERTEWHSVTVWGKRAEGLNKILQKGSRIYVEGSIQTRSWDDKDGSKRYATEINAQKVLLCGGKGGSRQREELAPAGGGYGPPDDGTDDQIPFSPLRGECW